MWQARKNEEEKCRIYFAKVYELKKEEAMKTKVTFEKLNCDFWNLSELKEPFEKGELYHKASGQFYRIKNRSDLSLYAVAGSGVYKLVETPVTLEDDLLEIGKVFPKHELGFILADDNETLKIYYREFYQLDFETKLIHALSEALKRHGK